MSKLRVHNFSISLDGYGAGPRQGLKDPLGVGGEELHGAGLCVHRACGDAGRDARRAREKVNPCHPATLRSDAPIAQRLDREDNREPTGHSEDIQNPDEQQGAALLEKLRAQSIPHVQRQHASGHHAAQ